VKLLVSTFPVWIIKSHFSSFELQLIKSWVLFVEKLNVIT